MLSQDRLKSHGMTTVFKDYGPRTLLSVLQYTLYRFLGIIREEILGFLIKLDEEGLSVQWWGKKDDWLWLLISFSSSRRRN